MTIKEALDARFTTNGARYSPFEKWWHRAGAYVAGVSSKRAKLHRRSAKAGFDEAMKLMQLRLDKARADYERLQAETETVRSHYRASEIELQRVREQVAGWNIEKQKLLMELEEEKKKNTELNPQQTAL